MTDIMPEQLRSRARDLISNGHPWAADALFAAAARIEALQGATPDRLERLQNVVRNAIPHQTNQEVRRWLSAAVNDIHPLFANDGRRLDVPS